MISVFIVEDNPDIQLLLQTIVSREVEYACVGVVTTGTEALRRIPELLPDVVLMDIGLPDISGIDCVRRLKPLCPNVEFIMCTVYDEDEKVFQSLEAGANSYILKKSKPELLLTAIREVYEGGSPMSSDIARKIVARVQRKDQARTDYHITPREVDVLTMLAKGLTYNEVADALFISVKTLKKHIYNIYEKLHVDNKVEALNKYFGKF
ncbi:response regulator transcription factor [Spirosoma sp. BT702]|uniref:Response regulator transcription factor n=1 Tax=Spirosoma profusum TaxID=2771354 RepID=A0A927AWB4_9BACT|nr:response regulator transcription factor [Spirosoma profusum]MBD2705635.1 response regulator transcription factor [Spirosoma profusum]